MNFDLSEQQRAFQDALDTLLKAECPLESVLATFDPQHQPDQRLWSEVMNLGVGGLLIAEEYGGSGLELLDAAVMAEIAGRHLMPGPLVEHFVASYAIGLAGTRAQQSKWLPALACGEKRATVAFCEGTENWLPCSWRLAGESGLSGRKSFVPFADSADLILVGLEGGQLGIVEAGAAGLRATARASLDGSRRICDLDFDATPVELIGEPGASAKVYDAALILLAADAFGGASRCAEMTVEYAKERVQFGQPIGQFQAVKHQLADMVVEIEPAVGLYWYAAHAFDHEPDKASMAAALAKSQLCDVYTAASRRSIELFGGIGYTWEFGAHMWLKRAVFNRNYFGRPSLHRARYADMAGW